MNPRIYELLSRLEYFRREAHEIERELAAQGIPDRLVGDEFLTGIAERLVRGDSVLHALSRVDFRDDFYRFVRAIDGDTLVVEPPLSLQEWIKDIHVRLYGIETPELHEEHGEEYRKHLDELCSTDAASRLMIVWERERLGNNYSGFPLSSFERGIGHVFFRMAGGRYLYVNGLMLLLRRSSLLRAGKSLLRGGRRIKALDIRLEWPGPCPVELDRGSNASPTLSSLLSMHPPACLLAYEQPPSLDPRDEHFEDKVLESFRRGWTYGCPFELEMQRQSEQIQDKLVTLHVSPFDIPLSAISMWAADRPPQAPDEPT